MALETGFPSPARGYEAQAINLDHLMVHNPAATFFMRMEGFHLMYRGILAGDLLVVDRSRAVVQGALVVFRQDAEFTCRELVREGECLVFADGQGKFIKITEDTEIFGTVTGVVRKL